MISMEAIYTTTGVCIKPYKKAKLEKLFNSRAVFVKPMHRFEGVTAQIVKDSDGSKCLCTYECNSHWLKANVPDALITLLHPNRIEKIEQDFELKEDIIPTDMQEAAVRMVTDFNMNTAFFNIPTGFGKTLLSTYLISLLKDKAWIICFRQIVLDQWAKTMETMTTFDVSRVKRVNSSKDLLKMATGEWDSSKYDVYLSTPVILASFAQRYGLRMLNDAMETCGIGVKFFDEAHYNVAAICKINALTNIKRTYYLSADFGQSDPQRARLYYKMFDQVPIITPNSDLAMSMRYTIGVVVRYNTHPNINEMESCFGNYGFNHYKYMEYQSGRAEFRSAIEQVLIQIRKADPEMKYKILLLWNLTEHVDRFYEGNADALANLYPDDIKPHVVRYHSKLSEEERKDALENGQIIISTYQSMSVGADLKRIRYVISLSPVSHIEDNQAAGRARPLPDGEDCFYFIFQDDGFPYIQKKLPQRLKYLNAQKIKKIYSIKFS